MTSRGNEPLRDNNLLTGCMSSGFLDMYVIGEAWKHGAYKLLIMRNSIFQFVNVLNMHIT